MNYRTMYGKPNEMGSNIKRKKAGTEAPTFPFI
jgi:hypothetical protein